MKANRIYVINGPNLNRLGRRDKSIYGSLTLDEINELLIARFAAEVNLRFSQHNDEGGIINALQQAADDPALLGVVINPGAYAHYSHAIADALADLRIEEKKVVEVHISNIAAREEFRSCCVTGAQCIGIISGFGPKGYAIAVDWLISNGR